MKTISKLAVLASMAFLICVSLAHRISADKEREAGVSAGRVDDPWSAAELMQPDELARSLSSEQKPAVLQIGIVHLYKISHIPGSKYAGPANGAEGLGELKKQAQGLNRNSEVVCYCGCCPWVNCPNTRPAYQALREMGFKKIKMLYLPNSFGEDWIAKGYLVEKGS